jgi:predicted metal-dependent hydrolase
MHANEFRIEKEELAKAKHEDWLQGKYEELSTQVGHTMDFTDWKQEVDELFKNKYECTWKDLNGDDDYLLRNLDMSPEEFVEWFADKHNLISKV